MSEARIGEWLAYKDGGNLKKSSAILIVKIVAEKDKYGIIRAERIHSIGDPEELKFLQRPVYDFDSIMIMMAKSFMREKPRVIVSWLFDGPGDPI